MNLTTSIKLAMKRLNIRKSDLARLTGYDNQYINDLLNGRRSWNEESLAIVCSALNLEVSGEEDEKGDENE